MNRNISRFIFGGIIILVLILFSPLIFQLNMTPEEHYRNVTFLIPIVIALFFIPISVLTLKKWDIHINFVEDESKLRLTISNFGETTFNFNKIAFVSYKRFFLFGRRVPWPSQGLFDNNVELHGAETPSRVLHEHTGCTVRLGMPIQIWIRPEKLTDYLRHYRRPRVMIYFEGTDQYACSNPIPKKLLKRFIK